MQKARAVGTDRAGDTGGMGPAEPARPVQRYAGRQRGNVKTSLSDHLDDQHEQRYHDDDDQDVWRVLNKLHGILLQ